MERRHKKRKAAVASEERSCTCVVHDLPDDLLWRILIRLDNPIWLMRAACCCKRWRRVVTGGEGADADQGRAFLRLASLLHPPTIVGQYQNLHGADHRFVVPSSPPAAPIIDGSRFVDDRLLQRPRWGWTVVDCHGGLVLLRMMFGSASAPGHIVYDPLTRRHHEIHDPPPPEGYDYVDGVIETWLLDGDDGDISVSNFRVIFVFRSTVGAHGPRTCVFSTANGGEDYWRSPNQPAPAADDTIAGSCSWQLAGRVDGCLYVRMHTGSVIAFDKASLVFSKVQLPTRIHVDHRSTFSVVHGGTGGGLGPTSPVARTTTTSIVHVRGKSLELFREARGSGEWVLERSIANLSKATRDLDKSCRRVVAWTTMVDPVVANGAGLWPSCQHIHAVAKTTGTGDGASLST